LDNPRQFKTESKEAGLFIVSTPIGNLSDMTYRAVNVLKDADLLLCEDTRVTRKLLSHYAIAVKCESYNDHNGDEKRPGILKMLHDGMMVALVSDAGTPLVSDPGYKLVKSALSEGIKVHPIPGASAIMAALVMSGMPSDVFTFCGFAQDKKFKNFRTLDSTLIYFESAKRLVKTLAAMQETFGNRSVSICREVTKLFEEVKSGSFEEVMDYYTTHPPKGEIVILLSAADKAEESPENYRDELEKLLETTKLKDASEIIGEKYNINKKKIYELGLALKTN
jgi:16S rRNA (cytidine1402-2'-O)-methyltransferase